MIRTHQSMFSRVPKGSGQWFLKAERFADWHLGRNRLLWSSGILPPLSTLNLNCHADLYQLVREKSDRVSLMSLLYYDHFANTQSSIVAEHLFHEQRKNPESNTGVALLYLKYNDPEQTSENILGSLSHQLAQGQQLPTIVQQIYQSYKDSGKKMTLEDISEVNQVLIDAHEEVFIIIDALDECDEDTRWGLIEKLLSFGPKIRLLITSRFQDSINAELEDFKRL